MSHMSPGGRHAVLLPPQAPGGEGWTWSPHTAQRANVNPAARTPPAADAAAKRRYGTRAGQLNEWSGTQTARHALPRPACRPSGPETSPPRPA
jgi:hypothetical protein